MVVELSARAPRVAGNAALVTLATESNHRDAPSAWWKPLAFQAHLAEIAASPSPASGAGLRIVLGLGGASSEHPAAWRKAAQALARAANDKKIEHLLVDLASAPRLGPAARPAFLQAFAVGLHAGAYVFTAFRAPASGPSLRRVTLVHKHASAGDSEAVRDGHRIGLGLRGVRDIANQPGNAAPPRVIADFARALARRQGMACEVWNAARLRRERCGALLAVARGSHEEPRMIILRHAGRRPARPPVVLVGKTITFDTGGVSLKPAKNMEWMRYDKSGGMAVLAAMSLIAQARLPCPVIGILAAAENMPGGGATRPGDIVRSRSGKSIEIINTDAEGRLVLADALSVALDYKPAAILDAATLTGAAVTALGHVVSAVMGNRAALVDELVAAGEASGDRVWPLPLHDEYLDMLRTPFADLRNTGDGTAGAIAGGMFLKQFVPDTTPWAHVDLTNAWEERDLPHAPAGANLFGAQLLYEWVRGNAQPA